jgi:uncharacterized protein
MRIDWLDWHTDVFRRAEAERRIVLLALGAAWCPWTRRMDETCYRDREVVALVVRSFVPVRVDADRRPDIADRYHCGGWPTTAFLTPDGHVLSAGTYVPPERMTKLLRQVAEAYGARGDDRRGDPSHGRHAREPAPSPPAAEPDAAAVDWACDRMRETYDLEHGGFGTSPKVPQPHALLLALDQVRVRPQADLQEVVTGTLDAMAFGPLYDEVSGGFFRYADGPDWSNPHHEKLSSVNAAMLRVYLEAWARFARDRDRDRALDIMRYVSVTLSDPEEGGFFASQSADPAYYTATAEGRRTSQAPAVDRTLFTDANGLMVASWLRAAELFANDGLRDVAIRSLERVILATYRPGHGVAHYAECAPCGEEARLVRRGEREPMRGLLADQVATTEALLETHAATGNGLYVELAEELMRYALRVLWDDQAGGFFDRRPEDTGDIGRLGWRLKPLVLNCDAARVLIRLARSSGEHEFADRAREILRVLAPVYREHDLDGAAYGLAVSAFRAAGALP